MKYFQETTESHYFINFTLAWHFLDSPLVLYFQTILICWTTSRQCPWTTNLNIFLFNYFLLSLPLVETFWNWRQGWKDELSPFLPKNKFALFIFPSLLSKWRLTGHWSPRGNETGPTQTLCKHHSTFKTQLTQRIFLPI